MEKGTIAAVTAVTTKAVAPVLAGAGTILTGPVGIGIAIAAACKGASWIIASVRDPNPKHNDDINVDVKLKVR